MEKAREIYIGKIESKAEVARAMLKSNMPVDQIASLTGFSVELVYELQHEQ